jgi:hypothetical protein
LEVRTPSVSTAIPGSQWVRVHILKKARMNALNLNKTALNALAAQLGSGSNTRDEMRSDVTRDEIRTEVTRDEIRTESRL